MKRFKVLVLIIVIVAVTTLVLCPGCRPAEPPGADVKTDIVGQVITIDRATEVERDNGVMGQILVDAGRVKQDSIDKAWIEVSEKTRIQKSTGQVFKMANFNSIQAGDKVRVSITGPVMESYPVQAKADEIFILP